MQKNENQILKNVQIFHLGEKNNLEEKIFSSSANINSNEWILNDVAIFLKDDGIFKEKN